MVQIVINGQTVEGVKNALDTAKASVDTFSTDNETLLCITFGGQVSVVIPDEDVESDNGDGDIVEHGGQQYRKVERKAVSDDLILLTEVDTDYLSVGDIKRVQRVDSDGDAVVLDRDNDTYFVDGKDDQYVVLELIR